MRLVNFEGIGIRIVILQTIGGFHKDNETGGGVVLGVSLAKEWTKLGNEVCFVTNSSDHGRRQYDGLEHLYYISSHGRSFLFDILLNFRLQQKAIESIVSQLLPRGERDTIVLTMSPYPSDVLAAFYVSRRFKLPSIVRFYHLPPAPWHHPFKRGGLVRATINWLMSQAALCIVKVGQLTPSICHPRELLQSGWKFPSGILKDDAYLTTKIDDTTLKESRKLDSCYIGRISANKGVIDLIYVWKQVTLTLPKAKLLIAGKSQDQRLVSKLKQLVNEFRLGDNVVLQFGYMGEVEKKQLLANSKLFLFPSYEEGWSLSVMEAASYRALPIIYDLPAYDYLGPNAPKVKCSHIKAFASEVVEMLQNDSRRCFLSHELKKRADSYGQYSVANYQLNMFKKLLETGEVR